MDGELCVVDLGGMFVRVEPWLLWTVHTGQSREEFADTLRRAALKIRTERASDT
jgi:hypothetical protein